MCQAPGLGVCCLGIEKEVTEAAGKTDEESEKKQEAETIPLFLFGNNVKSNINDAVIKETVGENTIKLADIPALLHRLAINRNLRRTRNKQKQRKIKKVIQEDSEAEFILEVLKLINQDSNGKQVCCNFLRFKVERLRDF